MNTPGGNDSIRAKQLEDQLGQARREINNLRQQLKTLNHVHRKECDEISKKLQDWKCMECRNRQATEEYGAAAAVNDPELALRPIGVVHTNFPEKRGTPRQPGICADTIAKLVLSNDVFTNPCHAVEGLQEFSHMWILFHFHKNESTHTRAKISPPRLNGTRTGVFATRSPHRPNPIGLSLVKIDRILGNTVYFSGVDMIDQTPVIDIKPYIPQYDNPSLITLSDTNYGTERENTQIQRPNSLEHGFSIDLTQELGGLNVRVMDGEETDRRDLVQGAVGPSNSRSTVDELSYTRLNSRIGEREAPDGEEEETHNYPVPEPQALVDHIAVPTTPEGHIRVPSWIDHPPVPTLTVYFRDRAVLQLNQLGPEGEEKKRIISNVLREDPRSVYLRERWGSHCYVFRISELYVSCKFNDAAHTVTVYQVFQNDGPDFDDGVDMLSLIGTG